MSQNLKVTQTSVLLLPLNKFGFLLLSGLIIVKRAENEHFMDRNTFENNSTIISPTSWG